MLLFAFICGILTPVTVINVAASSLDEGLVLWYQFNDVPETSVITDSSGNGHNGTLYGGATQVDGVENKALSFNGIDSYINMGTDEGLQPSDITVSFWYKRTAASLPSETMFAWAKQNGKWDSLGWYFTSGWEGALVFCTDGSVITAVDSSVN